MTTPPPPPYAGPPPPDPALPPGWGPYDSPRSSSPGMVIVWAVVVFIGLVVVQAALTSLLVSIVPVAGTGLAGSTGTGTTFAALTATPMPPTPSDDLSAMPNPTPPYVTPDPNNVDPYATPGPFPSDSYPGMDPYYDTYTYEPPWWQGLAYLLPAYLGLITAVVGIIFLRRATSVQARSWWLGEIIGSAVHLIVLGGLCTALYTSFQ